MSISNNYPLIFDMLLAAGADINHCVPLAAAAGAAAGGKTSYTSYFFNKLLESGVDVNAEGGAALIAAITGIVWYSVALCGIVCIPQYTTLYCTIQ